MALIDKNATVHDFSFKPAISASRKQLLKLPLPSRYLGYSDDKGILYFIDSGKGKKTVTKYHPALNKNGHQTIPFLKKWRSDKKSIIKLKDLLEYFAYQKSTLIGRYFWFYSREQTYFGSDLGYGVQGCSFCGGGFGNFIPFSGIWHTKKESAYTGPNLFSNAPISIPMELDNFFCSAALNSTHAMIIGLRDYLSGSTNHETIIMNFETNSYEWVEDIELNFYDCLATMIFDKHGRR